MQRTLAQDVLARVFGILDSLSVAAMLAGSLIAPVLVEAISIDGALVIAGVLLPLLSLFALPRLSALARSSSLQAEELRPLTELLSRVGAFEGASRPALERLARAAESLGVPIGDLVVAEGEPAQDFYVVVEGRFEVLSAGEAGTASERVNELGAGDHFGEIGLLENILRTATVKAVTPGRVLRIDGDTFVRSVTTATVPPINLIKGISARMARTHPGHKPRFVEEAL